MCDAFPSCRALKALNGYSSGPASYLISVLFGYSEPGILSHQCKHIHGVTPEMDLKYSIMKENHPA